MSGEREPVHVVNPPIAEAEEIPYEPADKGPGIMRVQIDFDRGEFDRLRAGLPDDDRRVIRFIKRAALERADAEARRRTEGELGAAD